MSVYYGNIKTSSTYGQFYNPEPWAPSSLLRDPMVVKNKVPVRPGRTNEDYGDFYGDPKLRSNIRSYLGGYWGRPSAVKDQGQPQPLPRDWSREKEVMRSYPGAIPEGRPSIQDGREAPPDPRRSAYDGARHTQSHPQEGGSIHVTRALSRPRIPRWDLQVDPWKSEYRRHYRQDRDSRLPELHALDQMMVRRGLGDGGMAYADEYPRVPPQYLQ